LVILFVAGLVVLQRNPQPADLAVSAPAPVAAPLVVGDHRTVTLISLGGRATDELLNQIGADIGPATAAVEAFWGTDWTHDILIIATGSVDQFAQQAGTAPRADTAALALADQVDAQRRLAIGERIVLAPGAAMMNPAAMRIVLTHELFHYAARADTAATAPRWLTEGVADYVARPAVVPARYRALGNALPADADFGGDPQQLSAAYDRAWLFARFVADRYGPAALRGLYVQICGPRGVDPAAAMTQVLGTDPEHLLPLWRRWLTQTVPV